MPSILINFILFQAGWFACVLSAAYQQPWIGTLSALAIVAYHLSRAGRPLAEMKLIGLALLIGFFWDSLLVSSGLLIYQAGMLNEMIAPHWIIAIWALFASTLNVSLRWLKGHYLIAALFGMAGGPLAYYAGSKLGAVSLLDTFLSLAALGIGWAFIMPLLMFLSDRFDGFERHQGKLEVCDA